MSQYENYSRTAPAYDDTRVAVGVELILAALERTAVPLERQHVLEAGCGTGNYLAALQPHVGALTGIDVSRAMLERARQKLHQRAWLVQGDVLQRSFEAATFDGVVCIQVLHHLQPGPRAHEDPRAWTRGEFGNLRRFLREVFRVLRPGSALVINQSSHRQLRDGFWWAALIPEAVGRVACRYPDLSPLQELLAAAGFAVESVQADLQGVLQGAAYDDPRGPLDAGWRAGDSTWSLASPAELAQAQARVRRLIREDRMSEFLAKRQRLRREAGQTTFVCARKA